jgi:pre-60S factor REI1
MDSLTCTACRIALTSQEEYRNHYKTEFHTYNLKRKYVSLEPVTLDAFHHKLQESQNLAAFVVKHHKCDCCGQTFPTQGSLNKHLRNAQIISEVEIVDHKVTCLFCNAISETLDLNLKHMSETHGFFIPNIDLVNNLSSILEYLNKKVRELMICLYCNSRNFRSPQAVQQHMIDKQHCFLNCENNSEEFKEFYKTEDFSYDIISSEDEIRLEDYIDIGSLNSDTCSYTLISRSHGVIPGITLTSLGELKLENGKILGHKEFARYYRQSYKATSVRIQQLLAIVSQAHEFSGNTLALTPKPDNELAADINKKSLRIGLKGNMLQHHFRKQN